MLATTAEMRTEEILGLKWTLSMTRRVQPNLAEMGTSAN
jgi:hypothetical protein